MPEILSRGHGEALKPARKEPPCLELDKTYRWLMEFAGLELRSGFRRQPGVVMRFGSSIGLLAFPLLGRQDADVGSDGRRQLGCGDGDFREPGYDAGPVAGVYDDRDFEGLAPGEAGGA